MQQKVYFYTCVQFVQLPAACCLLLAACILLVVLLLTVCTKLARLL